MSRKEDVYSPTFDIDQHDGSEEQQIVELRRMKLYHGFQTLIDDNTPLMYTLKDNSSFNAIIKTDAGDEKTVDISCDRAMIGFSCWGPNTMPLEIRIFLPENPEYFVLRPLGKGHVMRRGQGLVTSPQALRDINLGDILRLETILSHIKKPTSEIKYNHVANPMGY